MSERQKASINIEERGDFKGTSRMDFRTATELSETVNSIFQEVFSDYNGCYVEPGNRSLRENPVMLVLDFIPGYDNGKNAPYKAFQLTGASTLGDKAKGNGPIASAVTKHNMIVKERETYEITQDAVDILYELLIPIVKANTKDTSTSFKHHNIYQESVENVQQYYGYSGGKEVIHEYIRTVDMSKLINAIFPKKDEEGNTLVYEIEPARPIPDNNMNTNMLSMHYLYSITRHNLSAIRNVLKKCGTNVGGFSSRIVPVEK